MRNLNSNEPAKLKRYKITGYDKDGAIFFFEVISNNFSFSDVLKVISKDQYITDMIFHKLKIEEDVCTDK